MKTKENAPQRGAWGAERREDGGGGAEEAGTAPACHGPTGEGAGGGWVGQCAHAAKLAKVLGDFGDEGECAGGAVVGYSCSRLKSGGHDGRGQRAQEQREALMSRC